MCVFRFNGKEMDPETGNYYYGARYYDPRVSVWLSVDPLATHPNQVDKSPYAFSWNNPVNIVDPNGLCPDCPDPSDASEGDVANPNGQQEYMLVDGEWTGVGGNLNEVTVTESAPNNNPSDNTNTSNIDPLARGISEDNNHNSVDYEFGLSTEERTRQANFIDKFIAKNVDPNAVNDLSILAKPTSTPKDPVIMPTWIEGLTEFFSAGPYKPTDDSILTYWPNNPYGSDDTVPVVRPYLTNGGGVSPTGRPGRSRDTLGKSTESAKKFFR